MICAVCAATVARGNLVAEGLTYYHPRCHSVLEALRGKLRAAVLRAVRAERDAQRDRSDAAITRVRNMELETENTQMRLRVKSLEKTVAELREQLTREHQNNRRDREDRELAASNSASLKAENDALRNELQSYRALAGGTQTVAPVGGDPPKAAEDGKDPSVIRASLLELD